MMIVLGGDITATFNTTSQLRLKREREKKQKDHELGGDITPLIL
jgi:hypothetical protein